MTTAPITLTLAGDADEVIAQARRFLRFDAAAPAAPALESGTRLQELETERTLIMAALGYPVAGTVGLVEWAQSLGDKSTRLLTAGDVKASDLEQQLREITEAVNYVPGISQGSLLDHVSTVSQNAVEFSDERDQLREAVNKAGATIRDQAERIARLEATQASPPGVDACLTTWPAGVSRADYKAWKKAQEEKGQTEHLNPLEFKRQQDAGVLEQPAEASNPEAPAATDVSEATGLKVDESEEMKAPSGKRAILTRLPDAESYRERYSLTTPRKREIGTLALFHSGRWRAETKHAATAGAESHLAALAWLYGQDEHTAGAAEASAEPEPQGDEPATAGTGYDWPKGTPVTWSSQTAKTWATKGLRGTVVQPTTMPNGSAGFIVNDEASDRNMSLPAAELTVVDSGKWDQDLDPAKGETRPPAERPSAVTVNATPNPAAPPEVQAATVAIAEWKAETEELVQLEVGQAVTAWTETGEILSGTIDHFFEGSDKVRVDLGLGNGCAVVSEGSLRGPWPTDEEPDSFSEPDEPAGVEEGDLDAAPAGFN